MIVCVLEKNKDLFRLKQEGDRVLRAEYPYLSVVGAFMYLANNTRLDIVFAVNCLVRHSATPTIRYCNSTKNILRYLNDTIDLGLFFQRNKKTRFNRIC
jgi:hypothetical protein